LPIDIATPDPYIKEVVFFSKGGRTGFDGDEEVRDAYRGP
jgi:hypothetical protein